MSNIPEHIVERVAKAVGYELGFDSLPQDRLYRIASAAIEALGGAVGVMQPYHSPGEYFFTPMPMRDWMPKDWRPALLLPLGEEGEQ